eukprot:m.320967 g.320967  ORF g.320967 m.320967 type:complete len:197 (+) comp24730_c0_seq1:159-749(+)
MDYLVGIVGKDFVLVASDCTVVRSVVVMKQDQDKMVQLSPTCLMLTAGEVGDCSQFGEFIKANVKLTAIRTGLPLSTWATANYVRKYLADTLRTRDAYQVNLLLAGCDDDLGPQLYFMDHLAAQAKVPFAAHGYGAVFTLSVLDRWYRPGLSLEEARELLQKCVNEVKTRFMVNKSNFKVRVVDANGTRDLDDIHL